MGVLLQNNLTYGEIHFGSISECFFYIQNKFGAFSTPGGTFVDLGSVSLFFYLSHTKFQGAGKGVLTAALMHPFDKCIGIELLEGLYKQSEKIQEIYIQKFKKGPKIELKKANFLEEIWNENEG